ncbi:MAG: glycosyltransferase family 4 protein [Ardenticatenaceae bacterium]|nr:glycosyltransferase family 4 protein [Ardenticatenaceae bacterium]
MTILLISHTANMDGAERTLLSLATSLHEHEHSCIVMCPTYGPLVNELTKRSVPVVIRLLPRPQRNLFFFIRFVLLWPFVVLYLAIWISKNDINFVINNTVDALYGPFAAKLAGAPCLWHIHEIKPKHSVVRAFFSWMFQVFSQNTVFNSKATMLAYNSKMPANWHVIYNGIDIPKHKISNATKRNCIVIGFAGQLVQLKRPDRFVYAVAAAKKKVSNLSAIIAGEGELFDQVKDLIATYSLSDSVKMLGYVEFMPDFYNQIDILVLTSDTEAFGRVLIEAMAAGCPVVAAKVDGVPEVVDETCGYLVPPDDIKAYAEKIVLLSQDADLRHRLGNTGRKRAIELFSESKFLEQMINLISNHNVVNTLPN